MHAPTPWFQPAVNPLTAAPSAAAYLPGGAYVLPFWSYLWPWYAWSCPRLAPISGRYEGESEGGRPAYSALDLRVDIDPVGTDSPVMQRVSGDLYGAYQRDSGDDEPAQAWRVYHGSWIVDAPLVTWSLCSVQIVGRVRWWRGRHPETYVSIHIPWTNPTRPGPAEVTLTDANRERTRFTCSRASDSFRSLALEVDVVRSVEGEFALPSYDTHSHPVRRPGLSRRTLTVEEAYREAGLDLVIRDGRTIIDDAASEFETWSAAELHDVMETHFSRFSQPWPQWEMWGLLASECEESGVGGMMFDAAAAYGGAGDAPERQGFAVFRNHPWFRDLPEGPPADADEAAALRKFLYTWVHEAGHAFNLLHSWNENRPDSLSWMNYDWRYDNRHGAGSFWRRFEFRFDDEELIHLRHGDRAALIMGGDPWASGGHAEGQHGARGMEAPPGAWAHAMGSAPLELLIRSRGHFEFLEPVDIEIRLRNRLRESSLEVDPRLDPAYGGTALYIKRPDGRIVEYEPVVCKLATPEVQRLAPEGQGEEGADRYSASLFLGFGRNGFYFDVPGDYAIRAFYQGPGNLVISSNVHRIRVGYPTSKEKEQLALDFFTYPVGMALYLGGSQSPHLAAGMNTLRELADRQPNSLAGAKAAEVVADSLARPFFRVEETEGQATLRQTHKPDPQEAVALTEPAASLYREAAGSRVQALNLSYHHLIRKRAEMLVKQGEHERARQEVETLKGDLAARGVNTTVLEDIEAFRRSI